MALSSTILQLLLVLTVSATLHSKETQTIPQIVNSSLIIDIVKGLHQRLEFKNFVFYIAQRLFDTNFFQDFWQALPLIPVTIISDNSESMVGLLSRPCLCFIFTTDWQDPIMELAALSLESIRYLRTMFVLFPVQEYDDYWAYSLSLSEYTSVNDKIRLLYDWVWQKQFLNTLLVTIHNNIYLYEPFPKGKVVNVTLSWSYEDFFKTEELDLKGFEINTPLRFDLPRVFCLRRQPIKVRLSKLTGTSGKLFAAFIEHINGSLNDQLMLEHEFEPFNVSIFIELVELKQLEISVHSYTCMQKDRVSTSYPVGINDMCVMVPFRGSSPEYKILLESFLLNTWFLLAFAAVYIALGIWLCSPKQQCDLSLAFLQAICSLLLIAPLKIISLPSKRLRFLFVVLFVVGFCLTNMYSSKMASYLTTYRPQQQINTIQDVIAANLTIMMLKFEYQLFLKMNYSKSFMDLILPVSQLTMDEHRNILNTSYGYGIPSDVWHFLAKQQQYLKKPLFRLSSICIGPFYHVFPLQIDSYLLQSLDAFIWATQQTGFKFFWENEAFNDALFMGYVQRFKNVDEFKALSLEFYHSIGFIWLWGLLMSAVICVLEIRGVTWSKLYEAVSKFMLRC